MVCKMDGGAKIGWVLLIKEAFEALSTFQGNVFLLPYSMPEVYKMVDLN